MKSIKYFMLGFAVFVSAGNVMAQSKSELELQNENLRLQIELEKLKAEKSNSAQPSQINNQPVAGNDDNGGRGAAVQLTRLEKRQFEDSAKLRAIGEGASREPQSARNIAEQQARAQMQRNIETFVKDGLDRYRKETQMDDAEKYQANDEQLSTGVAKGILSGCRVIDYDLFYNSSTKKYTAQVLVEYDKQGVIGLVESQEAAIMKNRAKFEKQIQDVFDEYEMEKTGSTHSMRKAAAENAMQQDNLDRQAKRDAQARQQEADNELRKRESQQNFRLKSQQQLNKVANDLQEKNIDNEIINGTNNNNQ